MLSLSPAILSVLSPFRYLFSKLSWNNAVTLFVGVILCRGKRTVCAALRVMGLSNEAGFAKYHHLLNRTEWSLLAASKILLNLILGVTGGGSPLVLFIDETLERRKGSKIKAKGYYRDAVRSSKKVVVKSSGLKGNCMKIFLCACDKLRVVSNKGILPLQCCVKGIFVRSRWR